ncbi:MAG: hypothetical protein L6V84_04560 [Oscillospiraceae bacterium]|nr:MAG: hypothetical protein L6V84_04560 [Oscillospiraceae bacterium]
MYPVHRSRRARPAAVFPTPAGRADALCAGIPARAPAAPGSGFPDRRTPQTDSLHPRRTPGAERDTGRAFYRIGCLADRGRGCGAASGSWKNLLLRLQDVLADGDGQADGAPGFSRALDYIWSVSEHLPFLRRFESTTGFYAVLRLAGRRRPDAGAGSCQPPERDAVRRSRDVAGQSAFRPAVPDRPASLLLLFHGGAGQRVPGWLPPASRRVGVPDCPAGRLGRGVRSGGTCAPRSCWLCSPFWKCLSG